MFKTHPDNMRMEPTPERVYSVCKLVANRALSKEDIRDYMSLSQPSSNNHSEINASIAVATDELGVLQVKDNIVTLIAPENILASPVSFRQYVSSRVFQLQNSTFYHFSKWYISKNDKIFELDRWEDKSNAAKLEVNDLSGLNENAALGWRFWASFLGLGYLSGTAIIPNMKTRLQDAFVTSWSRSFHFDVPASSKDFLLWISSNVPEVDVQPGAPLPMALSAGLRTLHELSLIELKAQRDTDRVRLYPVDAEPFNDFSHLTVKEAIRL